MGAINYQLDWKKYFTARPGERKKQRRRGHKVERRKARENPEAYDTYKAFKGWEA